MNQVQARKLLFRLAEGCPAPLPVPLSEAPSPEFDLGVALICPQCGSTYCRSEVVEGVRQACCNTCGCEFCQAKESVSRRLVRSIMERERRRRHVLDIPTMRHKGHKMQHGTQQHNTEQTGIGVARKAVNDRVTTG